MKLTDAKLKSLLGFLLKNKSELFSLLEYFEYTDIENGKLLIPDYLINEGLKDKLLSLEKVEPYLKDYMALFKGDCILLDLKLNLKQLGPIGAKYMLSIKDFMWSGDNTRIYATFTEEITPMGNMMQNMALKALLSGGTCLQKAVQLTGCNFILVDNRSIMIDLNKFDIINKIADVFELNYNGCGDGLLKFTFHYHG